MEGPLNGAGLHKFLSRRIRFCVQRSFAFSLGLRPVSLKAPHCGVFLALDPQDDNEGGDSGYGIHLDTDHSPPLGFLFLGRLFLLYLKRKRRKNPIHPSTLPQRRIMPEIGGGLELLRLRLPLPQVSLGRLPGEVEPVGAEADAADGVGEADGV